MSNINPKVKYTLERSLGEDEYIADIIDQHPDQTINQWSLGSKVAITANTGSGKTYFIMNNLYALCKEKHYKMLLLTNRNALKEQLIAKYGDQSKDVVTVENYQGFIQEIKYQREFISIYNVIVADESHYYFSDGSWAVETDIPLKYLINSTDEQLVIFMSATIEILNEYFQSVTADHQINFFYKFIKPYKFDKCYYWNDVSLIKKVLLDLPEDEKAVYFCSNIKRAYDLYQDMPNNSTFICSKENKMFGKYSNSETWDQIKSNEKFDKQILFTTTVLENGINLIDRRLKHIIIDLFDFDTIIQCIGRKRIGAGMDLPNIYIKQFTQPYIQTRINNLKKRLEPVNDFNMLDYEDFGKKYSSRNLKGLLYTENLCSNKNEYKYVINTAKVTKYNHEINLAEQMNKLDGKFGHLKLLCKHMGISFKEFQDLSLLYDRVTLQDHLEAYIDKKLFKEDKTKFIQFLQRNLLKPLQGKYNEKTVNDYFNDLNLPYQILAGKERSRKSDNYNRHYWMLVKVEPKNGESVYI